jgi:hypothetical protein
MASLPGGFAGDGRSDFTRHLELRVLSGDSVALSNESKVGVGDLGLAVGGLAHQHADRPIEARVRVGLYELDAEGRIAEQDERRLADRQVGGCAKLLLVDGDEVADALGLDGLLDSGDGLIDRVAAGDPKDTSCFRSCCLELRRKQRSRSRRSRAGP